MSPRNTQVTFRFRPAGNEKLDPWEFKREMPTAVVRGPMQTAGQMAVGIIREQTADAASRAGSTCSECSKPSTTVSMSSMFYLHLPEPMVMVLVHPVCPNAMCHQAVQQMMAELMAGG
ncbi:hypothetical protein L13192_05931 [Pyrenophora tritici-repentis]|nr:hypothetical protein L13192_05931 [Pyrenophora tritici-repentis]KAI1682037.1 hypothetical protein KJE20_08908 [Pyrenophora tritici-repentis]